MYRFEFLGLPFSKHLGRYVSFNNYVDRFFFWPPPPLCGQFLYPEHGQKQTFLTPSPPHIVHVVIEYPLSEIKLYLFFLFVVGSIKLVCHIFMNFWHYLEVMYNFKKRYIDIYCKGSFLLEFKTLKFFKCGKWRCAGLLLVPWHLKVKIDYLEGRWNNLVLTFALAHRSIVISIGGRVKSREL